MCIPNCLEKYFLWDLMKTGEPVESLSLLTKISPVDEKIQ